MIRLTAEGLREIFPKAPQEVLDAFLRKQSVLDEAGVTHTRTRLGYFFANVEHETGGFSIKNLTENINYTPERAAQIWPSRFSSASQVRARYGTEPGWQYKMFDDVYGNRMGNRPGTRDGSRYIGRGGPQWTGREGYEALQRLTGIQAVETPELAARPDLQPEVSAAFWEWKRLNSLADQGNFVGVVKRWNGGTIGIDDRRARLAGNDRPISALPDGPSMVEKTKKLPGQPPTPAPPPEVVDDATKNEKRGRDAGVAGGAVGVGNEGTKVATQDDGGVPFPLLPSVVAWTLVGVGVAVAIFCAVMILRKRAIIEKHWF